MRNQLLISFILITLAVTGRSEDSVTAEDAGVFIIAPGSLESACNKTNIYSSYQFCKCEESCWKDNNCCPDDQPCAERQYKDEELICVNTLQGNVYMVNTCPPGWRDDDRAKCQTTNETELVNDFLLTIPVTTPQNITYRNLFCAVCNNVPAYVIWNVALRCDLNGKLLSKVNLTSLLTELNVDPDHPQLISNVDDTPVRCTTHGYLPSAWIESVRFCGPSKETRNCPICQSSTSDKCVNTDVTSGTLLSVPLRNPYIPRNVDEETYEFIYENSGALSAPRGRKRSEVSDLDLCFPKEKSRDCFSLNAIAGEFNFTSNETIFVSGQYQASFGPTHWNRTLVENAVYFCPDLNTSQPEISTLRLTQFIIMVLDVFSTICLIAFFVIVNSRRETKLQNLTYKIICSFAITLLALYIIDRIPIVRFPCTAFFSATSHYLYLSLYVWILIAAYDFWRVICLSPDQYQIVGSNENHFVRYIAYSLTGWIAPLSIIFIALYFDAAPIDTIPCDLKPAYGRTSSCFIEQEKPTMYLYSIPCTVVFFVAAVLFIITSYRVHRIKRENQNSVSQNEFFSNFMKLSSIMSLFALDVFWMYTSNEFLYSLYYFATGILGILIFFAFAFEKRMVSNVIGKIQK